MSADPAATEHDAYVEEYRARKISLSVNRSVALSMCNAGKVPGAPQLFFMLVCNLGCAVLLGVAVLLWYFGFWAGILTLMAFVLVAAFAQQLACHYVIQASLQDLDFRVRCLSEGVITVIPVARAKPET